MPVENNNIFLFFLFFLPPAFATEPALVFIGSVCFCCSASIITSPKLCWRVLTSNSSRLSVSRMRLICRLEADALMADEDAAGFPQAPAVEIWSPPPEGPRDGQSSLFGDESISANDVEFPDLLADSGDVDKSLPKDWGKSPMEMPVGESSNPHYTKK